MKMRTNESSTFTAASTKPALAARTPAQVESVANPTTPPAPEDTFQAKTQAPVALNAASAAGLTASQQAMLAQVTDPESRQNLILQFQAQNQNEQVTQASNLAKLAHDTKMSILRNLAA